MLSFGRVLAPVEQTKKSDTLHQTCRRVSEKSAPRFESAIYANVVMRSHIEIARLRGVMRGLFGDVIGPVLIFQIPITGINLAENRIQGLLDASISKLAYDTKLPRNRFIRTVGGCASHSDKT